MVVINYILWSYSDYTSPRAVNINVNWYIIILEIERNLISERTKEALARKKAEGVTLDRPLGSKGKRV